MSNLSPRALSLYQAHGPGPVDWERMAKVVDRAVEMSQPACQPIETATPHGQTRVLVWDTGDKEWVTAKIVMRNQVRHDPGYWPIDASHWMPLPAPPATPEQTEGETRRG